MLSLRNEEVKAISKRLSFSIEVLSKKIKEVIQSVEISVDVLNDKELGRMLANAFNRVLRYNAESNNWYYYNGKVWVEDIGKITARFFTKIFADEFIEYCEALDDDKLVDFKALNGKSKRNTILSDAESGFPVGRDEFDRGDYLLNCQNGTLDLRTFEFKKHHPDDLLTKICAVTYDPNAKCERWERFIEEIMQGNTDKIDFLQRVLGYTLTGDVREEEFYIIYGATTRNGKSTLLELVSYLLGGTNGYAVNVKTATFAGKGETNGSAPCGDIARLAGVRMAVTNEFPRDMIIDTGKIKTLTGRDRQTARDVYSKNIEFVPQLKLFVNTNHLPLITDDTLFASQRVRVIEFNRHFREDEQDKTLKDTLKEPKNLSGILNWLLEGLKKYQKDGLTPPQAVIDATNRYREESDKIGLFILDCLTVVDGNTKFADVYEAYKKWAYELGYACEGKLEFKDILRGRNMILKQGTVGGKTERGCVKGYTIAADWQNSKTADVESFAAESAEYTKVIVQQTTAPTDKDNKPVSVIVKAAEAPATDDNTPPTRQKKTFNL